MKIKTFSLIMGLIFLQIAIFILIAPSFVSAQNGIQKIENPNKSNRLEGIVAGLTNFFSMVLLILIPLIVLYGIFLCITSGNNSERLTQGKRVIVGAVIGAIVILSAKAIMAIIWEFL